MTPKTDNTGRTKIQQLLAAIGSRQRDDGDKIDAPAYDWHQPHFFNSRQMKELSGFCAKAAALIAGKFGALCQQSFEVTIISLSEHFAGQFLGQEPAGQPQGAGNYYLPFGLEKQDGCGFVSIPPQTALIWTTQLLGDTDSKENATWPLSGLEASLLFDMASLIVQALTEAGSPRFAGEAGAKSTFRPTTEAIANRLPLALKGEEEFCKITFDVKKPGQASGAEGHILVLCDKLSSVLSDSQISGKFSEKDIARAIQTHIETIPVPITAQLASVPVTVEQLLNLAEGDILLLDKKIDDPASLIVAGKTICRGRLAKSVGKYSLVITETLF